MKRASITTNKRSIIMKKISFTLILFICSYLAIAETPNEITLTSTGIAQTEKEAILEAQRSALEQTYGTFVSANTELLNDEIVKDGIVSVSKGNVKSYKKLSSAVMPNGQVLVTIETTISIGKLVSFAKSKGSSAELAGQNFAMDLKMKKLRAQNTRQCLNNLRQEIEILLQNAFDYEITIKEPVAENVFGHPFGYLYSSCNYDVFWIDATIRVYANETGGAVYAALYNTISSLDIGESEKKPYEDMGVKTSFVTMGGGDYEVKDFYLPVSKGELGYFKEMVDRAIFRSFFNYKIEVKGLNKMYEWRIFSDDSERKRNITLIDKHMPYPHGDTGDFIYLCAQESIESIAWYSLLQRKNSKGRKWLLSPLMLMEMDAQDKNFALQRMSNWGRGVTKKKNPSQKKEVKSRKEPDLYGFLTGLKRSTSEDNKPKANKTEETSDKYKEAIFSYKIPFYVTEEAISLIQGIEIIK